MDSKSGKDLRVDVTDRQIFSIALPITLAILIPQLNLLVNSIFLGRLSKDALGNAGVTGIYYLIFAVAGNGINNALQTVFSRYAGSGRTNSFKTIMAQGIRMSMVFAFAFILFTWFLAPYILQRLTTPEAYHQEIEFLKYRIWGLPFLFLFQTGNAFLIATLNSRLLIIGFVVQASVNVLLDYLLIFGHAGFPAMGFNGAAVASLIAELSGALTVFWVLLSSGLKRQYDLFNSFSYYKPFYLRIFRLSIPLILQNFISIATWLAFFLMIESKGMNAKAISNTMRNVFGIAGIFVWALAGTTNVMVSNLIGQHKEKMVMPLVKRIALWSFGLCLILVVLLNIFPAEFFALFNNETGFIQEGIPVVRVVAFGLAIMSVANIWLNAVTGTGSTRTSLLIEILSVGCYIPYTWFVFKYYPTSLPLAWSNEIIYWMILLSGSYLFMRSKKWKKHLEL